MKWLLLKQPRLDVQVQKSYYPVQDVFWTSYVRQFTSCVYGVGLRNISNALKQSVVKMNSWIELFIFQKFLENEHT